MPMSLSTRARTYGISQIRFHHEVEGAGTGGAGAGEGAGVGAGDAGADSDSAEVISFERKARRALVQ